MLGRLVTEMTSIHKDRLTMRCCPYFYSLVCWNSLPCAIRREGASFFYRFYQRSQPSLFFSSSNKCCLCLPTVNIPYLFIPIFAPRSDLSSIRRPAHCNNRASMFPIGQQMASFLLIAPDIPDWNIVSSAPGNVRTIRRPCYSITVARRRIQRPLHERLAASQ